MLIEPQPFAKHRRPARVDGQPAAAGLATQPPRSNVTLGLGEPGSELRWQQLQQVRRGLGDADAWTQALVDGSLAPEPDLLAALIPALARVRVEGLLASALGKDPGPFVAVGLQEWTAQVAQPAFREAWLEPLLQHASISLADPRRDPLLQLGWLQLLGLFRDPRVAQLVRETLEQHATSEAAWGLLPLLGLQRQPQDGAWLLQLAGEPGPRQRRHQALEGLALGLSAWPPSLLITGLRALATDLDSALAAKAVDLLARLPAAAVALRHCLIQELDPRVQARVQRRVRCSPLVLLVHGRQGGQIPQELHQLAADLASRRGVPVLLQALTAAEQVPDPAFWQAAQRVSLLTLVPLLLLPGGHVRIDLPRLARQWHAAASAQGVVLRRRPFLGAWPGWQAALARELGHCVAQGQRQAFWLHHPLEGALADRYVRHLSGILGCTAVSTAYGDPMEGLQAKPLAGALLLPLTLAANRLSETLDQELQSTAMVPDQPQVLPPLLRWPGVHRFLLDALTQLP